MPTRKQIILELKKVLDRPRFEHSLRVETTAVILARQHGVSARKASLAALLHDYSRQYDRPGLLKLARRHKLALDPIRVAEPKLFHAELSALLAQKDFGLKERDMLSAIKQHTTGKPNMTKLEQIIYLADHLEEGRSFAGLKKTRALASRNLGQALAASASRTLQYLLSKGLPIHPGTVQTRNYYLLNS